MFFSPKRITLCIVSLALFMDVLDSNILNTAVPVISHSFQVSPIDLKIALISYLLSLAMFMPMSGWAADKYGTKSIFIGATVLFTLSSFFCGYAHSLIALVIARFIQGIGGAFMTSIGRLIIARLFQKNELVQAMSAVIIIVSIAVMLGPFVGGVIVDRVAWSWIFWVNIPVGLLLIALSIFGLKDNTLRDVRPFDFVGFILFGGSLAILCYSLSKMSESHAEILSALFGVIISLLMLVIYVMYAKRRQYPVIKISLLRFATLRISVFGNLASRLGFGGMPFLLPLFQQLGLGFSAQLSGLLLVPMALGVIFSKLLSLVTLRALGYRRFLFYNTFLVAITLSFYALITLKTPVYCIAILTFIFGFFVSMQYTGMNSLSLAEIPKEQLSASTSITSTNQILAQSLGVAVSAILLRVFSSSGKHHSFLSVSDFHHVFLSLALITTLSTFLFLQLTLDDGKTMLEMQ